MSDKEALCINCTRRVACMPYTDEDFQYGIENGLGNIPLSESECEYYEDGGKDVDEKSRNELDEFKVYAKGLASAYASLTVRQKGRK